MKESYVSYECAKRLKECGFDWKCDRIYFRETPNVNKCSKNDKWLLADWKVDDADYNKRTRPQLAISAPSLSLAQKWLREVKRIAINVIAHDGGEYHWEEVYLPNFKEEGRHWYAYREHPLSPTYESALSAGIDAALNLLTEKK